MTKEEASMIGFEIVAYSGDARSKLLLAVENAKTGNFERAASFAGQYYGMVSKGWYQYGL